MPTIPAHFARQSPEADANERNLCADPTGEAAECVKTAARTRWEVIAKSTNAVGYWCNVFLSESEIFPIGFTVFLTPKLRPNFDSSIRIRCMGKKKIKTIEYSIVTVLGAPDSVR
jgi:hypothetical protein